MGRWMSAGRVEWTGSWHCIERELRAKELWARTLVLLAAFLLVEPYCSGIG